MTWGAPRGVDDWVTRLEQQDPTLTTLHVFRARRFGLQEVQQLCAALQKNTTLTELYASGHEMVAEAVQVFSDMLCENSTLKSICIGNHEFGDEGLAALAKGVSGNRSLTKLDLESKEALGASPCPTLHTLQLGRNNLGDQGMCALAQAYPTCHGLEVLDLRESDVGPQGALHLAHALQASACRLARLCLSDNPSLGSEGVIELAKGVAVNRSLVELELGSTGAGDEGAKAMGAAVAQATQLRTLAMEACDIGPVGGAWFAEMLFAPSDHISEHSIKKIDLRGNLLDEDSTQAFARALCESTSVGGLDLDLGGSKVNEVGVEWFAKGNKTARLRLFNSGMGDAGVCCLARQLHMDRMDALEYLDLCGVGMNIDSARELVAALCTGKAPALLVIEVGANPAVAHDDWEGLVQELRTARPLLDVMWKTSDPGSQQPQD